MSQLATVLVAAASLPSLLASDLPEKARVEALAPYFMPAPGEVLEFTADELRQVDASLHPGMTQGHVYVRPPKGMCFLIRRRQDEPARKICKAEALPFLLSDIDRPGRLVWEVYLGDTDFGTRLTWPTPYRKVLVVSVPNPPDSTREVKFAKRCVVTANDGKRRALRLELFGEERWMFIFPNEDQLLPQPPPLANLPIHWDTGRRNIADASRTAAFQSGASKGGLSPKKKTDIDPNYDEKKDRSVWHIPRRNSYGMEASRFQPAGSVAPGVEGTCRYSFDGSEEDPLTGRIECRHGDLYSFVYAPLTCINELGLRPAP